jgi:hypothetical protein
VLDEGVSGHPALVGIVLRLDRDPEIDNGYEVLAIVGELAEERAELVGREASLVEVKVGVAAHLCASLAHAHF